MYQYDVIIIGGSFSGLSAAMSLGRSMRKVLVIDGGEPCNRTAPQAHNLIAHDGRPPHEIAALAKKNLEKYPDVDLKAGFVSGVEQLHPGFRVSDKNGDSWTAKKIILAIGVKDMLPELEGFKACWGISVIHCPYCHGFEYRTENTAIMASGETAFELSRMIRHWAGKLTIVSDGENGLTAEQKEKVETLGINIIVKRVKKLRHIAGKVSAIIFEDGSELPVTAVYARPPMQQHNNLAEKLGCAMTDHLITVDDFQRTSVYGVYAAGDNSNIMRSLAASIAAGTKAGALADREMIMEAFDEDLVKYEG